MNNCDLEAQRRFGDTAAYKEYEQKTANYTEDKWQNANNGLMAVFAKFADCKNSGNSANSPVAQALVMELQDYITGNYYTCTKKILADLGQMYVADERFKESIDKQASGTAEFVASAITIYCK